MKFEEEGNYITIPNRNNSLVYFLLHGGEVVYVGKSNIGIARPLMHKDKQFDTIKILFCDNSELDLIEDYYICKYKPKYNKSRNYGVIFSLVRVKKLIRDYYKPDFNLWELKKILNELNIVPFNDEYTGSVYITVDEYHKVEQYIKGRLKNEISQT